MITAYTADTAVAYLCRDKSKKEVGKAYAYWGGILWRGTDERVKQERNSGDNFRIRQYENQFYIYYRSMVYHCRGMKP